MIVQCPKCLLKFDDEFRWTFCPHNTFSANDGNNNFAHHPESYLENPTPKRKRCMNHRRENSNA